jgi:hypothetical protein
VVEDPADEAVDVFLRRADADAALAAVVRDKPDPRNLLSVVEIELESARFADLASRSPSKGPPEARERSLRAV